MVKTSKENFSHHLLVLKTTVPYLNTEVETRYTHYKMSHDHFFSQTLILIRYKSFHIFTKNLTALTLVTALGFSQYLTFWSISPKRIDVTDPHPLNLHPLKLSMELRSGPSDYHTIT